MKLTHRAQLSLTVLPGGSKGRITLNLGVLGRQRICLLHLFHVRAIGPSLSLDVKQRGLIEVRVVDLGGRIIRWEHTLRLIFAASAPRSLQLALLLTFRLLILSLFLLTCRDSVGHVVLILNDYAVIIDIVRLELFLALVNGVSIWYLYLI